MSQVCTSKQTDLNHASVEELTRVLHLMGSQRVAIIQSRPYLTVDDVYAIPTIPPLFIKNAIHKGRLCVTPLTIPPPAPAPCTAGQIDVNAPDAAKRLTKLLGPVIARSIQARQPYLTLESLRKSPAMIGLLGATRARLCATPPPVDVADGTRYGWVYTSGGAVSLDRFKLEVPSGRLTNVVGQWASIMPIRSGAEPHADYKIYGAWSGAVNVTIPRISDGVLPSAWREPVVLHNPDAANGADLAWWAQGLTRNANGTVTFATTTLSPYASTERDPALFFLDPDYTDPVNPELEARRQIKSVYQPFYRPQPSPMSGCTNSSTVSILGFVEGTTINCSVSTDSTGTTWTLTNRTQAIAAVFIDNGGSIVAGNYDNANPLMSHVLRSYNASADGSRGNGLMLLPDANVRVRVPEGSRARLDFDDALVDTTLLFAVEQLTDVMDLAGVDVDTVLSCFSGFVDEVEDKGEFRALFEPAMKCAVDIAEKAARDAGKLEWAEALKASKRFLLTFQAVGTLHDAIAFDNAYINMEHRLVRPAGGGTGGGGSNTGGGLDGTIPALGSIKNAIGKIGTQDSYLVLEDGVAEMIADGGSYQCWAQRYPVVLDKVFWQQEYQYPIYFSGDCTQRVVPTNWTNWILRWVDESGVGHGYWLKPDGLLYPIPDGGTYLCLANRYFILDWTPKSQIDKFGKGASASCS